MFLGVGDIVPNSVVNGVITRNNPGDWSINQGSSLTVIYGVNVTNALLRREGFFEDIQAGLQIPATSIVGSAQPQFYRPDVIGNMNTGQQLQPRTAFKVKGFKLLGFDVIYLTGTLALTSISLRVDQSQFFNNVALVPTVVLAAGANGLSTAVPSTGPFVTPVVLPAAQQIYRTLEDAQLWIDLTVVTPATSTFRLYGFDCDFEFNYN